MKEKFMTAVKWSVPAFFVLLGIVFLNIVHGHSFLGLICFCIAGVILCYYLLALLKKHDPIKGKVITTVFTTVLLLGLSLCAVTEAVIVRASIGSPEAYCPYIVVLGAKVNGTSPSLSLQDRIDAAYDYLTANPDTVAVLSGGQGPDEGISEAQCMYDRLTARGIPSERLLLEDQSTSTWKNLQFSLDLIEKETGTRPQSIGLLSSEYHLFRASLFAKECGVQAIGIPAKTSWISLRINYFTREVAGVWHYLILGGQYE